MKYLIVNNITLVNIISIKKSFDNLMLLQMYQLGISRVHKYQLDSNGLVGI